MQGDERFYPNETARRPVGGEYNFIYGLIGKGLIMSKEQKILDNFTTVDHISTPTRSFKVGEKVFIEDLEWAIIEGIYFDGKIYEVRGLVNQRSDLGEIVDFFPWYSIFPILDEYNKKSVFSTHSYSKSQIIPIRSLLHKIYMPGVDFNPDYQRDLVWDEEDKIKLIKSIMDEINIGLFVFSTININPKKGPIYEIVDGKQRLSTLKEYFEDKFEVDGYKFSQLRPLDRSRFLNSTVEVSNLGQVGKKQILKNFIALNRCGKRISEEHMQAIEQMYEDTPDDDIDPRTVRRV